MTSFAWTESTFAGMSRIRCKFCSWQISTNQPRNALGRWSKLRAKVWNHILENHEERVPEHLRKKK